MFYLLLGSDDFSKNEFIKELASKHKAQVANFGDGEALPSISELTEPSLFSQAKIFVIRHGISKLDLDNNLERLIKGVYDVILVEDKMDKRKTSSQALIKNKSITVKEFTTPTGRELESWVKIHTKQLGGNIKPDAVDALVSIWDPKFGSSSKSFIPTEPQYSLWQVHSELQKLVTYAAGEPVTVKMVTELIPQSHETEVWDIINAIADKNRSAVWELCQGFFRASDLTDEKAKIIQLNALLADQFRSIAMAQDWIGRSSREEEILTKTGWKSGRLFIVKRNAQRFESRIVRAMLSRLENLDIELKTSSTPPRALLDLILAQVL